MNEFIKKITFKDILQLISTVIGIIAIVGGTYITATLAPYSENLAVMDIKVEAYEERIEKIEAKTDQILGIRDELAQIRIDIREMRTDIKNLLTRK